MSAIAKPSAYPEAKQRLLAYWDQLGPQDRETLLAFAEFLATRSGQALGPAEAVPGIPEPKPLPRPPTETVIGAIRRLAQSYDMLDRSVLLHETSALMMAHILKGRPAAEVIDELEALFARHYQAYRAKLADPDL